MSNTDDDMKRLYKARYDLRCAEGCRLYSLECFGDHVAKREKYKSLDGFDALHYYLIQKHHWLPQQVKALNLDDLELLFAEEMQSWPLPKDAREPRDQ